jgi:hypothetical protein
MELENSIDYELRLLLLILRRNEPWHLTAVALCPEILREALGRA